MRARFILSIFLGWSAVHAQQVPFKQPKDIQAGHGEHEPYDTASETIVSTLSASTQHTTFLRLLQRAKCVPLLAHINTSTVFAPTDQAWDDWANQNKPSTAGELSFGWLGHDGLDRWLSEDDNAFDGDESDEFDNHNWALRQHLLYHMLNYTLPEAAFRPSNKSNVTTHTTLLFPLADEPEHPPVPEPGPPWLPRGGEGMLGGHGQRLRIARIGSKEGGRRGKVGVDWLGANGVRVWNGAGWKSGNETNGTQGKGSDQDKKKDQGPAGIRWTRNGALVGIDGVLEPPPSIETIIRTHPSLSYLSHLLPTDPPDPLPSDLNRAPHLTIFAPSNAAFHNAFDKIEKQYLEGGYGTEGVGRIVGGGVLMGIGKKDGGVGWRDYWREKGDEVQTATHEDLVVSAPSNGSLIVNGTEADVIDIFASNGVLHIVPSLLVPENFTLLNSAEKVLLSLNATRFVSLLRTANLSETYVGQPKDHDKEKAWTILAPTDEVLDMMDRWGAHGGPPLPSLAVGEANGPSGVYSDQEESISNAITEPYNDVTPLQALLQYHILPQRLLPTDIKDGMLVATELRTSSLKGGRQRLRVDFTRGLAKESGLGDVADGEIRFGGLTVRGKPVKSGKSIIYLVSGLLSLPDDPLQSAVSDLQLSTFIAAVYAADLDKAVKKNPGISYFMPRNRAFASLGLAMNYLLLPEGKDELRKLIRYHSVDDVIYSRDADDGKKILKTLEGGEMILEKTSGKNSSLSLRSPNKWEGFDSGESLPANGELRPASITQHDALTSTGVIHALDSVVMPADVQITIAKLVRGSKQSTMVELMIRAGFGWVLEGRQPSADEVHQAQLVGIVRPFGDDDDGSTPDVDSLALPAYTVLCPTDKAFSRLNLTHYLNNKDELVKLLKLHIIPTQPSTPRTESSQRASPPRDGHPLAMEDDLIYTTLLSSDSKYGEVAFRATGDNSFIVGIRNARSGIGNASGRIGSTGRASVRWRKSSKASSWRKKGKDEEGGDKQDEKDDHEQQLWRGGMTMGGGVVMIDSVLVPYEPSWFSRWGWLVLTLSGIGVIVLIALGSIGWWWFTRDKREVEEGYEPLEGEEEE